MQKTLLLVFIHGFKGGDDTFGTFPDRLRGLVGHALPKIEVRSMVYPKFETRGNLKECVHNFRDWLQNQVIDIEVSHQTPSPTIDPSVHTILIGHSMGGIVAAETLLLLDDEEPLPHHHHLHHHSVSSPSDPTEGREPKSPHFMFPHILGIVAYDTPFLGIAPGTIAHGAESQFKTASSAYNAFTQMSGLFSDSSHSGSNSTKSDPALSGTPAASKNNNKSAVGALPAAANPTADAAATPQWSRWGRYAMFAGAAGAVAAAGAGVYSQRSKISAGLGWVGSHLEFVGCLARGEEMRQRVQRAGQVAQRRGLHVTEFYTVLGRGANDAGTKASGESIVGSEGDRTFCNVPKSASNSSAATTTRRDGGGGGDPSSPRTGPGATEEDKAATEAAKGISSHAHFEWRKAVNDKAKDETTAHMSMFYPRDNPGFHGLLGESAKVIGASVLGGGWYESAEPARPQPPPPPSSSSSSSPTTTTKTRDRNEDEDDDDEFENVVAEENMEHHPGSSTSADDNPWNDGKDSGYGYGYGYGYEYEYGDRDDDLSSTKAKGAGEGKRERNPTTTTIEEEDVDDTTVMVSSITNAT